MLLLKYETVEPDANLAVEEALMEEVQRSGRFWLRLWRNRPSLIVGRFQHAPAEVNLPEAHRLGVPVIRRLTGGGAVYHDLGNLNYSLVGPESSWPATGFGPLFQPLAAALNRLGLPALASGRNDLTINGYKFAGAAFCRKEGVCLAHACVLYDVDLSRLEHLLTVPTDKLENHGVKSVRSRVTNLKSWLPPDLGLSGLAAELAAAFKAEEVPAPESLLARADFLAREKYATPAWNLGSSPEFNHRRERRFPWGGLEILLNIEREIIKDVKIQGDFGGPGPEAVESALTGRPYAPEAIRASLAGLELAKIFPGANPEEVVEFIAYGDGGVTRHSPPRL